MINFSRQMEVRRSRALGSSFSGCENCKIVCVWLVNKVHFLLAGDHPHMGAGSDPHRGSYFSLFCPCNPP